MKSSNISLQVYEKESALKSLFMSFPTPSSQFTKGSFQK